MAVRLFQPDEWKGKGQEEGRGARGRQWCIHTVNTVVNRNRVEQSRESQWEMATLFVILSKVSLRGVPYYHCCVIFWGGSCIGCIGILLINDSKEGK